ncbi:hypothetical protein C8F04DRAFT_1270162 [Mycena alexandri]|uniref:RING-type domain-containing protein n=1 Tax=Mycena alexandri TaxID=1745969 RepID=A0AAD6SCS1_9AGAR|nr:hypothetical protein C8F04DRAFT_1270162 [Mycena alexandri]
MAEPSQKAPVRASAGRSPAQCERIRRAIGNSSASASTRREIERERQRRGFRVVRDTPLTEADLYLDSARPPTLTTDRKHQTCSICLRVKSHPVAYLCGHSHCYVCIRLRLEENWTCPVSSCRQLIRRAPHRHHPEEEGIELDFSDWHQHNHSRVSYDWHGLTFPSPDVYV